MRILIVDDHEMTRAGLKGILQALEPTVEVMEAGDCAEAITQAASVPDLVLLDLHMQGVERPTPARIEALERVKAAFDASPVVVVSGDDDPRLVRAALDRGAAGYLPKTSSRDLIVAALRVVLAGGTYLPPAAVLDHSSRPGSRDPRTVAAALAELSPRQHEVLEMALKGKSNKVIANALRIEEGTVKVHLSNAYARLNVHNRTEATYALAMHGLLDAGDPAVPGRRSL